MPKFLTGCHYNEEEISRHLKKKIGYWSVQIHGNKFATSQILGKTGRSCEGADFRLLSSKVSRTLRQAFEKVLVGEQGVANIYYVIVGTSLTCVVG
jgi:hypothetical protein